MASIRDTLTKLLASDKPEPGTPLARAVGQYPFQQGEAPLEAPMFSPDDLIGTGIGKAALLGALGTTKLVGKTAQELAHEIASKNAEKMLGLPKGNTAMERAKALGFDIDNPVYHGTSESYSKIDPSKLGNVTKSLSAKKAFWTVDNPKTAEGYANYGAMDAKVSDLMDRSKITEVSATHPIFPISATEKSKRLQLANDLMNKAKTLEQEFMKNPNQGQNIMPLLVSKDKQAVLDAGGNKFMDFQDEMHNLLDDAIENKYPTVKIKNLSDEIDFSNYNPATHYGILEPGAIRSRFAAFDPKLTGAAAIAAGTASADLLAEENKKKQIIDLLKNK